MTRGLNYQDSRAIMREIEAAGYRATDLFLMRQTYIVEAHDPRTNTKTTIRTRADWDQLRAQIASKEA